MNKYRNTYEPVTVDGVVCYYIVCYTVNGQIVGKILIDGDNLSKCQSYQWHIEKLHKRNIKYAATNCNKKTLRLHRYITNADKQMQVDHINHNGLDNRIVNLRICNNRENNCNKDFSKFKNASKIATGIRKIRDRYFARIMVNKKEISLGGFSTLEEAKQARKAAEIKYFKEYKYAEVCNSPSHIC